MYEYQRNTEPQRLVTVDDARTGLKIIEAINGELLSVTSDSASNTVAIYDAAEAGRLWFLQRDKRPFRTVGLGRPDGI
ncbi:MAG: hypothetical protein ACI841_002995 [Planctomycetota bacterium]|jgi:hypothetical protein